MPIRSIPWRVMPGVWLWEALPAYFLAGDDVGQPPLLLLLGTVDEDRRRTEREAQVGDAGSASAGRLPVEHNRLLRRHPATTPLLGPSRRSPALLAHLEAVLLAHLLVLEALLLGEAAPWLCSVP